jgi:signal transduction histidine kinase
MAQSRRTLGQVLAAAVNAREQEAVRVSRLLHDDVGQILSAVGLQLDLLRTDVEADSPEVAARLEQCQRHLETAMEQVRRLNSELNPAIVERAGLQAAMDRLVGRYRDAGASIRLLFDSSVRPPLPAAKNLYRIAECALDNAVRHAGAKRIEVFVKAARAGGTLEVRDNGVGFDPAAAAPGLGLPLMEYYAAEADLVLSVTSEAGRGTIVRARFPATP